MGELPARYCCAAAHTPPQAGENAAVAEAKDDLASYTALAIPRTDSDAAKIADGPLPGNAYWPLSGWNGSF